MKGERVDLKALWKAVRVLEKAGFRVPEFQSLVGANAFKTKAGIHVDGLLKNPEVYLPFDPEEVLGVPYTVEITPYSGRSSIVFWLRQHGVPEGLVGKDDERVSKAYNMVLETFSNGRRRPLSDIEVAEIVKNVMPDVFEAYVRRRLERLELRPSPQPQLHSYHPPC
jgi:isopropylmalate/homocitrate/citramalate synthase